MTAFAHNPHPNPTPAGRRAALVADPQFGRVFTDHMVSVRYKEGQGWHDARLMPRGPLTLDPATAVQRYGAPSITAYSLGSIFGVRVTYQSTFDALAGTWAFGTPSGSARTMGSWPRARNPATASAGSPRSTTVRPASKNARG